MVMTLLQPRPCFLGGLSRCRLAPAARSRAVRLRAGGPGGLFDESPTEPVTEEQKQISDNLMKQMKEKIGEALQTDRVNIVDAYGNHQHVSIDVVSELFENKSAVQRQRMVYKAIWMELQDTVHAVDAMTTRTPAEAAATASQ